MPRPMQSGPARRNVNVTIRQDVIDEARALSLNVSQAAEAGVVQAIKKTREARWLAENRSALEAHNRRIESAGTLLTPDWVTEDERGSV